jgi:hypothetical protein
MTGHAVGGFTASQLRVRVSIYRALWLIALLVPFGVKGHAAGSDDALAEQSFDVVIVGAGTGGISAAIQAARLGAHVALVEETDWVGGQITASAVGQMDEGGALTVESGIYAEFLARMGAYYKARGKSVGTCYWSDKRHCFQPSAAQQVFLEMIDEVNRQAKGHVSLYLRERVVRVLGTDKIVTGVVTQKDHTFHSKIVIDATEFGDVLPLTPAGYRIGRFTSADPGKSCLQDITYVAIIRKYPAGVPPELMMRHAPPGYDADFIASVRRFLRADGNPDDKNIPVNFEVHNRLRALPDPSNPEDYSASTPEKITRTGINWFNDQRVDTDLLDRSIRQQVICAAKLRTLDFLYYIQHELKETSWSIANDEGYDTSYNREENSCPNIPQEFKAIEVNFPPLPYIRESRRLIGEYTLVGGDIRREAPWPDAVNWSDVPRTTIFHDTIAVGDYTEYFHDCGSETDLEPSLEHETDLPTEFRYGPFQIPIEVLIPEKLDGFLVAEKNISESRMVNDSTRLQPITMLIGQAAGALAAIAVSEKFQPREVDPATVQRALLDFNIGLAKQELNDLSRNTDEWKAAEFALVHEWITPAAEGFAPKQTLTRAQAAAALVAAFQLFPPPTGLDRRWGYQPAPNATFVDVPLYSKDSSVVESLAAAHAVRPCLKAPDRFCPESAETVADFIFSIEVLKRRTAGQQIDAGVSGSLTAPINGAATGSPSQGTDGALTRLEAAELLFRSLLKGRASEYAQAGGTP